MHFCPFFPLGGTALHGAWASRAQGSPSYENLCNEQSAQLYVVTLEISLQLVLLFAPLEASRVM